MQLDPLRIKLRVLPVSSGCQPKGMNSDFYFREATKKALQGDLPHAMDLLKRGLLMKPAHYQCRFNHGVIMFKFGLIREAIEDFKKLIDSHPHLALPHFNLAICLMQLGVPKNVALRGTIAKRSKKYLRQSTNLMAELPPWLSSSDTRYDEAIKQFNQVLEICKSSLDDLLEIDANLLKAVCKYRLHLPLEAVHCF